MKSIYKLCKLAHRCDDSTDLIVSICTHIEAEVSEGAVELYRSFRALLHLLAETLESSLQFVSQLTLGLLCRQVVSVMHVLVLPKVCRDLSDLCVELHVLLLLLAEHDRVFQVEMQQNDHLTVAGLEQCVLNVVIQDVDLVPADGGVAETVAVRLQDARKTFLNNVWPNV